MVLHWGFLIFGNPHTLSRPYVLQATAALKQANLGRALGHFKFSIIGLKRILFTNILQKL